MLKNSMIRAATEEVESLLEARAGEEEGVDQTTGASPSPSRSFISNPVGGPDREGDPETKITVHDSDEDFLEIQELEVRVDTENKPQLVNTGSTSSNLNNSSPQIRKTEGKGKSTCKTSTTRSHKTTVTNVPRTPGPMEGFSSRRHSSESAP